MKPIDFKSELDSMIAAIKELSDEDELLGRLSKLKDGWRGNKPLLKVYDWKIRTLYMKLDILDIEKDKRLRERLASLIDAMGSTMFFSAVDIVRTQTNAQLFVLLYDSIQYMVNNGIDVHFEFTKDAAGNLDTYHLPFRIFFETETLVVEGTMVPFGN
jgi:hypothetical protein